MKRPFCIPCTWQMVGPLFIEAESLEEAIQIANSPDTLLPSGGDYVDDSSEVDREGARLLNAKDATPKQEGEP